MVSSLWVFVAHVLQSRQSNWNVCVDISDYGGFLWMFLWVYAFILGVDDRYGDVFRQGCPCVLTRRIMCFLELECLLLRNDRKTSCCDHFPHISCYMCPFHKPHNIKWAVFLSAHRDGLHICRFCTYHIKVFLIFSIFSQYFNPSPSPPLPLGVINEYVNPYIPTQPTPPPPPPWKINVII